mmetsp:Transcript_1550/g.2782  ORF Transcript_1550/g.2782 Transcript_1550/m.2782 type:complete len:87 (+) Transcript_1550:1280-1540(+)
MKNTTLNHNSRLDNKNNIGLKCVEPKVIAECMKKPRFTRIPRTLRIHSEARSGNRFNRKGGAEYTIPRSVDDSKVSSNGVDTNPNG